MFVAALIDRRPLRWKPAHVQEKDDVDVRLMSGSWETQIGQRTTTSTIRSRKERTAAETFHWTDFDFQLSEMHLVLPFTHTHKS